MTACALSWPAAVVLSVAAVCLTVLLVSIVVATVDQQRSERTGR
jgi:hypothetical protein